jgi:PKD repeat protein
MSRIAFAARGLALLAVVCLGCDGAGVGGEVPPQPPKKLESSTRSKAALQGAQDACASEQEPRLVATPSDEASRPAVRLEGEGLNCGETYSLVITQPDGTSHAESLTADTKGKVQSSASPGGPTGTTRATLRDSHGEQVAQTLYYEPVFRYGHLTWRQVGPRTAEFSVVNVFRRVYPGTGPDGLAVTGDTFQEHAGSTSLCFGDGFCTWTLTYEVTDYDAQEGWVRARAVTSGEPQVLPGSDVEVPETEPNDGIYTPDAMRLGDDYASTIDYSYDVDYVRFTLSRATRIEVSTVLLGLWDSYLYLFDAEGNYITADDDGGEGYASRITITLGAGTYYIGAAAYSSGTGSQRVRLREVAIPPPGPITHSYGWDGPFTADISGCCRIDGLGNLGNAWNRSYAVRTGVDFTRQNNSPVSTLPPVVEAPANTPDFSFQVPATDEDGDTLTFRLATQSESSIASPPPGLTVSSAGVVSWNTVGTVGGQRWVVQVIIEESRDGQLIGSSAVDFLLLTTGDTGTAPTCLPPSQGDYTVMPGETVSFFIGTQDAEAWDLLTLSGTGLPWSAWLEPSLPARGVSGLGTRFTWTTSRWDAGATYPLHFTVTDSTGQQGECFVNITVENPSNWPPVVYTDGDPWGYEGQTVTLSGSAYDPDGDAMTYQWTLESGTGPAVTLSSPTSTTTTFRASDDGVYTFRLTATDSKGASGSATVRVTVFNREPQVSATGGSVDEGEVFTTTGSFTDPGADSWTATVDYYDGQGPRPLELGNGTFTLSHRFLDNSSWGSTWVRVVITDDNGGEGSVYVPVEVRNIAPVLTRYPDRLVVDQGVSALMPFAFTDPGADTWWVYMDYGDGYSGYMWSPGREFSFTHTWYYPGTYSMRVWLMDDDGGQHEVTIPVEVRNLPPVVSLQGDTGDEGSYLMAVGSYTDPESWLSNYTITVDYGDGSPVQQLPTSYYDNRFYPFHIYAESGTYQMTVYVTDALGATGQATATVVVNNVAPWVYLEAPYYYSIPEGSPQGFTGYFSDPGTRDTWTASINYGDGTGDWPVPVTGSTLTMSHQFADDGEYTVTLTVTDDEGAAGTSVRQVYVYNRSPVVSVTGGSLDEGSTFSATGSFSDVEADTWTARVDYGDGSGWQPLALSGTSFALAHTYARSGTYRVRVAVLDDDGAEGTGSATVRVRNVVPTVTVTGGTQDEGSTFTASGSFTDPGAERSWTAEVNYGDSSTWYSLPLSGTSFTLRHVYADNGTYTVSVRVRDGEGTGTGTAQAVIRNVAPGVSATPGTADEGASLAVTASLTDPGYLDSLVALIDYGDGSAVERRSLDTARSLTLSHRYADSGTYPLTITVTDDDGGVGTTTVPVQVRNVAPTMVFFQHGGYNTEGALYLGHGWLSEPGADPVTVTVDFGDGSAPQQFLPNPYLPSTFTASHVYADNGTYTLTLTLADDDGGTSTFTTRTTVLNVAPTVTASNDSPAYWGLPVTLVGTATDPSPVDTQAGFTALWTLGDGTTASGLTTAHAYAAPGTYQASLRVTDKDGGYNTTPARSTVTVQQRPGAVACADTTGVFGFPLALDARFVDGLAGALPGGRSVSFRLGESTPLGSATTDGTGLARVEAAGGLMPGSHVLTVSFAGDSHYTAAQARCTLTVIQSSGRFTGGGLRSANQGRGGFNVARDEGGLARGELQFQTDGAPFHAHELTALGISADQRQGWFAGVGRDGRAFTAYVEDNGEPGTSDVFKLWIEGVLQTGEGTLLAGNIQAH